MSEQREVQDPFSRLPLEIIYAIFRFLPGLDLVSLLNASWPALCATRHNSFWKRFLAQDMPWLTELWPLLGDGSGQRAQDLDYKTLFLWLNAVTLPRYGLDGPLLPLANRRRIWGTCEEFAQHYFRSLHTAPLDEPTDGLLEGMVCRHMAVVSPEWPQDNSMPAQTTLFTYSMSELDHWPVDFEAYWGEDGRLVGLCAVVGKQKRVFGLDGAGRPDLKRDIARIPAGERVQQVALSVAAADPNRNTTALSGIVRIEVSSSLCTRRLPLAPPRSSLTISNLPR